MRCAKCLKIMRHATVRSQIWERTDRNAIILLIILFTFLSPPNTYLSSSVTQLSLSLSLLSGLHLSVASYFFLIFIFFISHSLPLSLHFGIIAANPTRLSTSFSFFFFFSCHYLSLFLFLSRRRRRFRFEVKLSLIEARQFEPLLADQNLCSPKGSRRSLLVVLHSRWSLLVVLYSSRRRYFIILFCWGFWIWNLSEDLVIGVVVCGGGCSSGYCCGGGCSGGCSGGCWFLGGGDCHWLCICIFPEFGVNILF